MIRTQRKYASLAQSFYNRMAAAGVEPSSTQRQAIMGLLRDLDQIGLDKFITVLPLVGGTAATHALDLMGPRNVTWAGSMTHDDLGITGNTTNATGSVPFSILDLLGNSNFSGSAYCQRYPSDNFAQNLFGSFYADGGSNDRDYLGSFLSSTTGDVTMAAALEVASFPSQQSPTAGVPPGVGFWSTGITGAKAGELYLNGNQVGTGTGGSDAPDSVIGLLCVATNSGGFSTWTAATVSFFHFGPYLSAGDQALLYSAVERYQTALGRGANTTDIVNRYVARVAAAGVSLSSEQIAAVTNLTEALVAIGWSKFRAIYPYLGGTAATHALDLMDNYDITWSGTSTHDANGVLGNGSTGYGNTGLLAERSLIATSCHLSMYWNNNPTASQSVGIGSGDSSGHRCYMYYDGSTTSMFSILACSTAGITSERCPSGATATSTAGFHIGTIRTAKQHEYYFNGVSGGTTTCTSYFPDQAVYINALNATGTASNYSVWRTAFNSIGTALSDDEAAAFYTAVEAYQVALGREV